MLISLKQLFTRKRKQMCTLSEIDGNHNCIMFLSYE